MENTSITIIDDCHSKAVTTPEFVCVDSANIPHIGLPVNRELREIVENEYDGVRAYLNNELIR